MLNPILPLSQRQSSVQQPANPLQSNRSALRDLARTSLFICVFIVILVIPFTSIPSLISNSVHDVATGTLYHFHRRTAKDTPFVHFSTQHSIFTKRLSPDSLHGLLRSRRRLLGDTVNNTLVAACANTARIHPPVLSSWLSLHGVREVIIVHDSPSVAQSERALDVIDSVDRQGRIMYINFVSDGASMKTNKRSKHSGPSSGLPVNVHIKNDDYRADKFYNASGNASHLFSSPSGNTNETLSSSSSSRAVKGEALSSSTSSSSVPPPPTHAQRWYRSRAFNLGAAVASGVNLVLTDCRSMISVDALDIHTLTDDNVMTNEKGNNSTMNNDKNGNMTGRTKSKSRFYVSIGHERAHASDMKPIELVYVSKQHFTKVHGFDERLDVPGFDIADLVDRLSHISMGLSWDTMHARASHAIDFPGNALLAQQHRIVGIRTLESRAALIPELAFYAAAYAREQDEAEKKKGWTGILQDGSPSILSLRSMTFRVLRSHIEQIDRHSRMLSMLVPTPTSNARLWIHAAFGKQAIPSLLDGLPREKRASVLLKAHRKLLHDHHGIPHKLLNVIEGGFAPYELNQHSYTSTKNVSRPEKLTISSSVPYNVSKGASVTDSSINKTDSQMTDTEQRIEGYSPMLLDVLWRKAKLLVVNIEADYAMELFRGVAWAISLAVARNRALVIVGDLQGMPLVRLLDMNEISRVLYREYNVKLDIIGRPQLLNCSMESQSSCWRDDKDVITSWDEYRIEHGVSDLQDNASKHILLHVAGRDVLRWDERESLTAWQHQLEVHAFACLSMSADVKEVVREKGERGWTELLNRTALWVTRSSRDKRTMYSFASGYLKHLEQRKQHPSNSNHSSGDLPTNKTSTPTLKQNQRSQKQQKQQRQPKQPQQRQKQQQKDQSVTVPTKQTSKLSNSSSDNSLKVFKRKSKAPDIQPDDAAQKTKGNTDSAALLFTSDHAEMRGGTPDHVLNCVQNVADLWVVMQCKRIVFDSEETPLSWKGTDESILEWRRVHGYGRRGGIVHVRSTDVGADVAFHEMEFMNDEDDEEQVTPTATITYRQLLNETNLIGGTRTNSSVVKPARQNITETSPNQS